MNDRALVREQEREIATMKRMAAELWARMRADLVARSGLGYLRYTGKPGARAVKQVVDRCLAASIEWRDIETAIVVVGSQATSSPWTVFDVALQHQAERQAQERMMEKMRDDRPRVAGLRHIQATAE